MGEMQRQQSALFAMLGLSADHMGGVGPVDEALVEPPSQKKRKRNDGQPVPGSPGLQDSNGNLEDNTDDHMWHIQNELSHHPTATESDQFGGDLDGNRLQVLSEQELEDLASSHYREILNQVAEELGEPLRSTLVSICKCTLSRLSLIKTPKKK